MGTKKTAAKKLTNMEKAVLALAATPDVDPSEAEFAAAEAAAEADVEDAGTEEEIAAAPVKAVPGAWQKTQKPPRGLGETYKLITLSKPRQVLHDDVPASLVRFTRNDQGDKVLVFDGVKCPRGVITYHGVKCYLDGGPKGSVAAGELAALRARLAELEARSQVFAEPASVGA